MPSISPTLLSEWVQPGAVVAVAGLLLAAFRGLRSDLKETLRASETWQEKQIVDSRDEIKQRITELRDEFKGELKASEARQEKQMTDFRDEIKERITEFRDEFKGELKETLEN